MSGAAAARVLFTSSSRRGLGHLVRGLNIARALRRRDDRIEIALLSRGELPEGMVRDDLVSTIRRAPDSADWSREIEELDPRLTVWDTLLPGGPIAAGPVRRNAFVMRRCRDELRRRMLRDDALRSFDSILIPHDRSEFDSDVPSDIEARTCFVGPIVRRPRPELHDELRRRYRLDNLDFVLVSTLGGGGFPEHARDLLEAVGLAHRTLSNRIPRLRHIAIVGPRYAGPEVRVAGMRLVRSEPDLASLLGLADCVVAAGGYNTVNEIRINRVPAVLVPGRRTHDDQTERAERMAADGLAVVAAGPPGDCARAIVATCTDERLLGSMRAAHDRHPLARGNERAAEQLHGLIRC